MTESKRLETEFAEVDGYQRVTFTQSRGPTVKLEGRLLCETSWTTKAHQPLKMTLEVWETRAGALVAASISAKPDGEEGFEDARVAVIEPLLRPTGMPDGSKMLLDSDAQTMRFAVMDHFDWIDRARSMVRKVGWSLTREVA